MARKKCPREGSRLRFDANPASAALYSPPIPQRGEVGTVVSVPLPGAGRKTCTGGHSQDLVYVDWPSIGVMGVARADVVKSTARGPRSMQVNGTVSDMEPKARLLREYEEAVRRYVRGTGSQADLSKHASAAIMGGCSTQRLQEIRDRVQRELIEGNFHGVGGLSIGERVITPHGAGEVRSKLKGHVGVQLDDGSYVSVAMHEVQPSGERQRFLNGARDDKSYEGADPPGTFTTKVTRLGDGRYGCRVLFNGQVIMEQKAMTKADIGKTMKEMLRMVDKLGWQSPMAYASRHRNK